MNKSIPEYLFHSPLGNYQMATLRLRGKDSARLMTLRIVGGEVISATDSGCPDVISVQGKIVTDFGEYPFDCNHEKSIGAAVRVIYNPPATIAFWADGSKTVVKCDKDDDYDPKYGLALCYMKKALGSSRAFNDALRAGREEAVRGFLKKNGYFESLLTDHCDGVCPMKTTPCGECPYNEIGYNKCAKLIAMDIKKMREGEKHD